MEISQLSSKSDFSFEFTQAIALQRKRCNLLSPDYDRE